MTPPADRQLVAAILELDDRALIRVLGYLVARAEVGGWVDQLEAEIARQRGETP